MKAPAFFATFKQLDDLKNDNNMICAYTSFVCKDELDLQTVLGIWLGPQPKAPMGQQEFIEN